jgi:hypothetical protein
MRPSDAQTNLRWSASARDEFRQLAEANERSLNSELKVAIREHIERERGLTGIARAQDSP